jgi:hypothetical protein
MLKQLSISNFLLAMQASSDGVMSMPGLPWLWDPEHPAAVVASAR